MVLLQCGPQSLLYCRHVLADRDVRGAESQHDTKQVLTNCSGGVVCSVLPHAMDMKPGSAAKPFPGISFEVMDPDTRAPTGALSRMC